MFAQTAEEIQWFKTAFFLAGLLSGAFGLALIYLFIKTIRFAISSKNWPTVEGIIVSSDIAEEDEGYYPELSFSYNVDGVDYTSTAYNPNELVARSIMGKKAAESKIRTLPVGTKIKVFYKSDDPTKAVIEPGVTVGSFFFLAAAGMGFLFLIIFTPIGIFFNP
ncbi:MAG: DUF3592 domain-containing protein [Candidatus Hodarchaeales archaeon]|jgi:hypothetical protein